MTAVAFHFNVTDAPAYVCRLLHKARAKGSRLLVWCRSTEQARAISQNLWVAVPGGFFPHSLVGDAPRVRAASPVLLAPDLHGTDDFVADVLVNLGAGWPEAHARFERVIEVVSCDAADKAAARERWRSYKALGIEPQQYDLSNSRSNA